MVNKWLTFSPADRIPTRGDWARLSGGWTKRIDQRIVELQRIKDGLTQCIGCGCLSIDKCKLANPAVRAGRRGPGPTVPPTIAEHRVKISSSRPIGRPFHSAPTRFPRCRGHRRGSAPCAASAAVSAHCHERRPSLGPRWQYPRSSRPSHPLSSLRRRADRPRLVRHHGLASVCGGQMCHVRYALPWCI
jgi:hypothetical protein